MRKLARLGMVGAVTATLVAGAVTGAWATATHSSAPTKAAALLAATAVTPTATPENLYVPITSCRIVDTRHVGAPLAGGALRTFYVGGTFGFAPQGGQPGGCGVPTDATAVSATIIAVNSNASSDFKAWPSASPEPISSVLNFGAHQNVSSGLTLAITPTAGKSLAVRNYLGSANLVIDVTGYYVPQIEAYLGGDGSIQTGTSRVVSAIHAGTGFYYIDLDRPVRSCSLTATAYNIYRYASVGYSDSSTPNRVSVYVWYLNGSTPTPTDYPFHLHVSC